MSSASAKPVIFISYSHKDEPQQQRDGEIQWLTFVCTYLQPAVKHGIFDLWVDRHMPGGADWDPEIEEKLRACDIFILLVSANAMASDYIVDREIAIIRERQAKGERVHFYPLLLTPTPKAGLDKVKDKNLRPRDAKPFSSYSMHDRAQHMTEAADEIAELLKRIARRKSTALHPAAASKSTYVHISDLPETAYERLVGRDAELMRLDEAWADTKTNILSLIAEGGAGKSALVNEWLTRLQADGYRGAERVLGWSFYSQGSKERATSAEPFLNWALEKLGLAAATTSATAKGEAIAETLAQRRVLLVLDGVEPLQHGLDRQQGELKDAGLRALLRRFAAMPPTAARGLVVLTSRLPVKDIGRWKDSAVPVLDVEELSEAAGAALLRDNGVWGTDRDLAAAARDFGGHPLALGLLASFLTETRKGDVRRRDHVRAFLADPDNPRHDHARRVMESYETEWLAGHPVAHAIMQMVGLFDRPASGDCLGALRAKPAIIGLTDQIVELDESGWQRAVTRLREVRLLAPPDLSALDALDAHPLVREWFGERLQAMDEMAWRAAHGRLYDHLRDTTKEGQAPMLAALAPLYQAISHGCRAGRHAEVLNDIYVARICRLSPTGHIKFYARSNLGAFGSDLAAISWFFAPPYDSPVSTMTPTDRAWVMGDAGALLRTQGRFAEALPAERLALNMEETAGNWANAANGASNLTQAELLLGNIQAAIISADKSVEYAVRADAASMRIALITRGTVLRASGRYEVAAKQFANAELCLREDEGEQAQLEGASAYEYCDLALDRGEWQSALDRGVRAMAFARQKEFPFDVAVNNLAIGRAHLGRALVAACTRSARVDAHAAHASLAAAIDGLHAASMRNFIACGLLAHAAFHRSLGNWTRAARDLDEVEEIAGPGPMRLILCDMALGRMRLALARIEAFVPLNGFIDDSSPKPKPPGEAEHTRLHDEATKDLAIAADYIKDLRLPPARRGTGRTASCAARRAHLRRLAAQGVMPFGEFAFRVVCHEPSCEF